MKASDWISVKDRLPKLGENVLVCIEIDDGVDVFQIICKGYLDMYKNIHCPIGVWSIDNEGIYTDSITHWQKIVLPKKRKGMSEITTEKSLPQGWQDMLSAHRKYTTQANDINNDIIDREMKISDIALKRYTANKGKSLKWYEWVMNPNTRECERVLRYAECTAVIDTNQLDGDVMEIPYEEYKEWWDNNYHCLGVTGL